jgi:hypothetical protein
MNPSREYFKSQNFFWFESFVVRVADDFCVGGKFAQVANAVRPLPYRAMFHQKSFDVFIEVEIRGQLFQKNLNVCHHCIHLALARPFRSNQQKFNPRKKRLPMVLPAVNARHQCLVFFAGFLGEWFPIPIERLAF